jgi:shikimate dehydrogenase
MHNAVAKAAGLDYVYVPLPVRPGDVETAVPALPALGFRGVNVTIPHKQAVMPFLDEIDPAAQVIGAVNTIVVETAGLETRDYKTIGYNTDWLGFLADLEALDVPIAGRDCLVLGAGGSARAVAYGLAAAGGHVQVLARRPEQAQQLVADLSPHVAGLSSEAWLNFWPLAELKTAVSATTTPLIINTTPLGMTPNISQSPWPDDLPIPPDAFVYDLVYNPRQTKLMQQAAVAGCRTANGLGMLVHQGALAFQLWTGVMPDINVMRAVLEG